MAARCAISLVAEALLNALRRIVCRIGPDDVVQPQRTPGMQVWKKRGWRLGAADGVFVQLEARGLRHVWFLRPGAEAAELSEDFKLLEALFR